MFFNKKDTFWDIVDEILSLKNSLEQVSTQGLTETQAIDDQIKSLQEERGRVASATDFADKVLKLFTEREDVG